jgi:hypothetical protein
MFSVLGKFDLAWAELIGFIRDDILVQGSPGLQTIRGDGINDC